MTPNERIQVIEKSLRIFACGIAGLIPFIGLIPALYAISAGASLYSRRRRDWNPAAAYLNWGMLIGLASAGLWFLIGAIVCVQSSNS
ncbi:MAG TPA: hypothetical protein VFW05_17745 [Verrucomicrobiae bacterium]|jgi:hypothetical protein|nr:hypothetical protein [Verrucomicrobiae bacterium]